MRGCVMWYRRAAGPRPARGLRFEHNALESSWVAPNNPSSEASWLTADNGHKNYCHSAAIYVK
eukprot:54486-Eustigmatos_ZCMA.PRE.1